MVRDNIAAGGKASFDFEQVLPIVIRDYIPVGLVGILMAGLLAAFMSTFDSTVNSGAAYMVNDVYKRFLKKDADDKQLARAARGASVLVLLLGGFAAFQLKDVEVVLTVLGGEIVYDGDAEGSRLYQLMIHEHVQFCNRPKTLGFKMS